VKHWKFIWVAPLKLAALWLLVIEIAVWLSGGSDAASWVDHGRRSLLVLAGMYFLLVAVHALLWWNEILERDRQSRQR
jgi:hypothetical protein